MTTRLSGDGEVLRLGDINEFCEVFYDKSANAVIVQAPTSGTDNTAVDRVVINAGGILQFPVTTTGLVNVRRDDTATTASLRLEQDSTGDSVLEFLLTGGAEWAIGVDNSASDTFVISAGGDLGTGDEDAIRITDAAPPVVTYIATHPTGTFDYICDVCGTNNSEPFVCHGEQAPWHDDVESLSLALHEMDGMKPLHEIPAMQHLAKIGVLDMVQHDDGHVWTGINMAAAQWFTWSGMLQLENRIKELEAQVASK